MISLSPATRIFVYGEPAVMRRSFDRLAAMAREQLGVEPSAGGLFVFCNRRRDRLKLLYWDADGWAIWYKRLEAGTFELPAEPRITSTQLRALLDGVVIGAYRKRFRR